MLPAKNAPPPKIHYLSNYYVVFLTLRFGDFKALWINVKVCFSVRKCAYNQKVSILLTEMSLCDSSCETVILTYRWQVVAGYSWASQLYGSIPWASPAAFCHPHSESSPSATGTTAERKRETDTSTTNLPWHRCILAERVIYGLSSLLNHFIQCQNVLFNSASSSCWV